MASSRQVTQYKLPHISEYYLINNDGYADYGMSSLSRELGAALQRAQGHALDFVIYHPSTRNALAKVVTITEAAHIVDIAHEPPMDEASRRRVIDLLIQAPAVVAAELWDFCAHHKQADSPWPLQVHIDHVHSFAFAIREYGPNSIQAARHLVLLSTFIVHEYAHWLRTHGMKGIWSQSPPCFSPRSIDFVNTNECWHANEDVMAGEVGYWLEEQIVGGIMGFREEVKLSNPEGIYSIDCLLLRNVVPSRQLSGIELTQMMSSTFEVSDEIVHVLAGLDEEEGDATTIQFEKYLPISTREKMAPGVRKSLIHFRRPRIYTTAYI